MWDDFCAKSKRKHWNLKITQESTPLDLLLAIKKLKKYNM